jgi:ectoine hydroxylase-related dioxygenase (phytanoyl-CoA dioxygenase family)
MVQEKVLDQERIKELRSLVDQAIERVEEKLTTYRPNITIGKDNFNFREIASRNLERFDLRVTDHETCDFVQTYIMDHPVVKNALHHNLGDDSEINFDISLVYSKPGACAQGWHADGDHQKGGKDAGWSVNGWKTQLSGAYAFCLFIPLIDLNDEVGFTQFWPKSHYSRDLAGFGKVAELSKTTFDGKCAAGDAVWYDYRLMHRGMPNKSQDKIRPVLQVIFKKKWYVETSNFTEESIIPL